MASRRGAFRGRCDVDLGSDQEDCETIKPQVTTAELTLELAAAHRVALLGGLAVLAHGHDRPTYDADLWLDPALEIGAWVDAVGALLARHPELRIVGIGSWSAVSINDLGEVILRDRVIRIMGANQPLDIFREPNALSVTEFDAAWKRATPLDDGTRVPDVVDLLMTKQETGGDKRYAGHRLSRGQSSAHLSGDPADGFGCKSPRDAGSLPHTAGRRGGIDACRPGNSRAWLAVPP